MCQELTCQECGIAKGQKISKDRAMSNIVYSYMFYRIKPEIEQCQGQGLLKGREKSRIEQCQVYIFEYIFYRLSLGLNNAKDRA
jgi:hypothetical protein